MGLLFKSQLDDSDFVRTLRAMEGKAKAAAGKISGAFAEMNKIDTGGFMGMFTAGAAAVGLGSFAKSVVMAAAEVESLAVSFKVLTGSAATSKRLMEELAEFAKVTPFELPDLAAASKQLLAYGFAVEEILPTIQALGDVASGVNIPMSELADVFGRAKTSGRVYAKDLNEFAGRGIPIIGELAKQFGIADEEVRKLSEDGLLSFANLEAAMLALSKEGGKFHGMMKEQSQTTLGLLSTLRDEWKGLQRDIGGEMEDPFKDMVKSATEFTSVIRNLRVSGGNFYERGGIKGILGDAKEVAKGMMGMDVSEDFVRKEAMLRDLRTKQAAEREASKGTGDRIKDINKALGVPLHTDDPAEMERRKQRAKEIESMNADMARQAEEHINDQAKAQEEADKQALKDSQHIAANNGEINRIIREGLIDQLEGQDKINALLEDRASLLNEQATADRVRKSDIDKELTLLDQRIRKEKIITKEKELQAAKDRLKEAQGKVDEAKTKAQSYIFSSRDEKRAADAQTRAERRQAVYMERMKDPNFHGARRGTRAGRIAIGKAENEVKLAQEDIDKLVKAIGGLIAK